MKIQFLFFYFFFSTFFLFSQLKGKVVQVKDGDTIIVLDDNKTQYTIRVADIDCPEFGQPYSQKAKEFVIKEVAGKIVEVKIKGKDRYKRTIGFVLYKDKNLSEELLNKGLAWHYKYFSKDIKLAELETKARLKKIGLWKEPNPINPYLWRKRKKNNK